MRNHTRGFFLCKNRLKLKVYKFENFLIHFLLRTASFHADCHGSRCVESLWRAIG